MAKAEKPVDVEISEPEATNELPLPRVELRVRKKTSGSFCRCKLKFSHNEWTSLDVAEIGEKVYSTLIEEAMLETQIVSREHERRFMRKN